MIIGIAGKLSSGKDTVSEMLEKKGFAHISLSDMLREIVLAKGEDISTENLTKHGNLIRRERGEGYLAKMALKKIKGDTIISSIRQPGEVKALHARKDFYLIAVDAKPEIRWQRLRKRQRPGDPETPEQMLSIERRQMKSGGSTDMQIDVVMSMADFKVDNNGSLDDLKKQVDEVLAKIREKDGEK